jgi:chromate transporter
MQRDLVERRRVFSATEFSQALAFSQLAPGPLAAQVAIYLGWLRGRVRGATLAGVAFVLPSFLMVLALSALYVRFGGLSWMRGAFYGVGAAVIAIIARSAWRLGRLTLGRDPLLWVVALVNAGAVVASGAELLWVVVLGGVIVWAAHHRPARATSPLATLAWPLVFDILWFFTKAGSVVFGSGLAIIPFLYGGVVREYAWLTEHQFLDAVAVGMITPGPVVITVAFIGYVVEGPLGAVAAAIGVFLPVYLATVLGAPYFTAVMRSAGVRAFVAGITAAAAGAVAGAAVVIGQRAIPDVRAAIIALVALGILARFRHAPEPLLVLAAGAAGVVLARP